MSKPFDQALYDANDERGRQVVKAWFEKKGFLAKDFFKYDVDLIIKKGNSWIGFVEVEVRSWDSCSFNTIHVAKRKEKLLRNAMTTVFFAVGNSLKIGYWCNGKDVLESPVVEVKNKFVFNGEYFYDVPLTKFKKVNL